MSVEEAPGLVAVTQPEAPGLRQSSIPPPAPLPGPRPWLVAFSPALQAWWLRSLVHQPPGERTWRTGLPLLLHIGCADPGPAQHARRAPTKTASLWHCPHPAPRLSSDLMPFAVGPGLSASCSVYTLAGEPRGPWRESHGLPTGKLLPSQGDTEQPPGASGPPQWGSGFSRPWRECAGDSVAPEGPSTACGVPAGRRADQLDPAYCESALTPCVCGRGKGTGAQAGVERLPPSPWPSRVAGRVRDRAWGGVGSRPPWVRHACTRRPW